MWSDDATTALAAGTTLDQVDSVIGMLGDPVGVKCYRPCLATGEDFLHDYLGMLGVPIDMGPEFPAGPGTVLLTASAKHDPEIVDRIMGQLVIGRNVVITSGLLRALQGQGAPGHRIEDIAELVEPFLPEAANTSIILSEGAGDVRDLLTGEELSGEVLMDWWQQPTGEVRIDTQVGPHKYRVFRLDSD